MRDIRKVFAAAVIVAMVGLSLFSNSAWAFTPGNHDEATGPALECKVSPDAMEAIKKANREVDDAPIETPPAYQPPGHFDRDPRKTSDQTFREGVKHVQDKKAEAIAALERCDTEAAIKAIGEALHAIQDFYAHSNYVDLSPDAQKVLREAFDNPDILDANKVPLPGNLRLETYYPIPSSAGKYNPLSYNPQSLAGTAALWYLGVKGLIKETDPRDGTPFDHGLYLGKHKDNSWSGDGPREITRDEETGEIVQKGTPGSVTKTAFEWAMEAAKKHSQEFIDQIIEMVGQDLWNQKLGKPDNYKFPPPPEPPAPSVPPPPYWPQPYRYIDPTYPYPRFEDGHDPRFEPGVFGLVPQEGGILDDGEGTAVFIPSDAIFTPQWFYAFYVSLTGRISEGVTIIKVREFWPDGIQFQNPVTISIVYNSSEIVGINESSLRVYEFDLYHDGEWRLIPDSTLDTVNRTVTFQTSHFGIYGIGGSPPLPVGGIVELPGMEEPRTVTPDLSDHNYGALTGIIVGAIVGTIMLISAVWYVRRRRTKAI